jgi:hypothetical protein
MPRRNCRIDLPVVERLSAEGLLRPRKQLANITCPAAVTISNGTLLDADIWWIPNTGEFSEDPDGRCGESRRPLTGDRLARVQNGADTRKIERVSRATLPFLLRLVATETFALAITRWIRERRLRREAAEAALAPLRIAGEPAAGELAAVGARASEVGGERSAGATMPGSEVPPAPDPDFRLSPVISLWRLESVPRDSAEWWGGVCPMMSG